MENKTFDGQNYRQLSTIQDLPPDELRDFIDNIILVTAYDNTLVDAAFKGLLVEIIRTKA